MVEPIRVQRREPGGVLELVGDWPAETAFDAYMLGQCAPDTLKTTIKVSLGEGWALYRVTGGFLGSERSLIARRIRRGRADRLPKSDKS